MFHSNYTLFTLGNKKKQKKNKMTQLGKERLKIIHRLYVALFGEQSNWPQQIQHLFYFSTCFSSTDLMLQLFLLLLLLSLFLFCCPKVAVKNCRNNTGLMVSQFAYFYDYQQHFLYPNVKWMTTNVVIKCWS